MLIIKVGKIWGRLTQLLYVIMWLRAMIITNVYGCHRFLTKLGIQIYAILKIFILASSQWGVGRDLNFSIHKPIPVPRHVSRYAGDYFAQDTILINWFSRPNITMQGDGIFPQHLAGKSPAFAMHSWYYFNRMSAWVRCAFNVYLGASKGNS